MNSKLTRFTLISLTLLMPIILWLTRIEDFPSMSAFANAPNVIWYHAMHLFGSWFFLLNGAAQKRSLDYFIGFSMGAILLTNMYVYPTIHNIFTGLTIVLAVTSMNVYSSVRNRYRNISLSILAVVGFLIGYLTPVYSIFLGEWITMACVSLHMMKRINRIG
jgi:hypothetical protein